MSDEKLDLILAVVSDIKLKTTNSGVKTDKQEIGNFAARIDRLEKQIIYYRMETLENKSEIRELNKRLSKLENNAGL